MASVTIIPNGYTHTGSYNFTLSTNASRQISNAYHNADNTSSSARLQLASNRNSTRTSTMYLEFDKSAFDNIPSNATINSVTANVRYYVNNTTYVSALSIQLHANTTAKGYAETTRSTTSAKYSITAGTWTLAELKTARLYISATHNASTSAAYVYLYGADITVNYTASTVHVTGVSLDVHSKSIEIGETFQLTETVSPSNASDKSVSWSTGNSSIATVSGGLVTGVATGSTTITVTTTDGGYTDTCTVTVTQPVLVEYVPASSLIAGQDYLIVNVNSGSGYAMTSESGGSGILKGAPVTITNNKLYISQSNESKSLFTVELDDPTDTETIWLKNGTSYLYSDSTNHLRMDTARTPRYWHYVANSKNLLWFFNGTTNDYGYTDTSGTYKYYLECSNGNFNDNFVTSPSLADQTLPSVYLFVKSSGQSLNVRVKQNGSWVTPTKILVKSNGSWVEARSIKVKDNGTWK